MISLCDSILKPISENFIFFVCFYITGLVVTLSPITMLHAPLIKTTFLTWIFDIYLICLCLLVFGPKYRIWIGLLIAVPFYILTIVDAFCVLTHQTVFNPEILNLIMDTNNREASEYLHQYLKPSVLVSPIGIILLIFISHLFLCRKTLCFKVRNKIALDFVKIVFCLIVFVSILLSLPHRLELVKILMAGSKSEIGEHVSLQVLNSPFNNLAFGLKLRELDKKELIRLVQVQQNALVDSCSFETPEIVFIIGESYIKVHSQLYGYEKETTPLQKQRTIDTGNGELIPFTNVVTSSNYTSHVFKSVFSLKSVDDDEFARNNASIFPVLFKKAGYHVTFISSQFFNNSENDVFDLSGGLFLNNAHLSSLAFDYRNDKQPEYDETLLDFFDSLKVYNKEYNLTIFHLIGQHIDFYKRSPEKWKKFQVKDYQDRKDVGEEEKAFIADYDNATLYNDYVVNEIIKRFEDKEAVVIYMPDHGEGCYDDGHKLGRMPKGEYTKNILENEYNIPFWIWYSKQYQNKHPQICQQIKDAQKRPFMTDDIPHLLLYLGGIKCHEYQDKKNLISPNYDIHRKRLLNGEVNYDSIISSP